MNLAQEQLMASIADQSILITGAASGIGRLLATELASKGAKLILWDIQEQALSEVAQDLVSRYATTVATYCCDLANPDDIAACAQKVLIEHPHIDVLVNNAGVVSGKAFLELTPAEIQKTFAVNTLALFWTAKAFLPAMVARNSGHLVTVASAAGLIGVANLVDYSASKFAAVGFDEALRAELRHLAPGVRTSVICPFFIDTGMFAGVHTRFPWLLPILSQNHVAKRIAKVIEKRQPRLYLPPLVHIIAPARLLPLRLFDTIAEILGINQSMHHFTGRPPTKPRPEADN